MLKPRRLLFVLVLLLVGFLAWRLQGPEGETQGKRPPASLPAPPSLSTAVPIPVDIPEPMAIPPGTSSPTAASEVAFLVGLVTCRETGRPIPGVNVWAYRPAFDLEDWSQGVPRGEAGREGLTDAEGRFRIRIEAPFSPYCLNLFSREFRRHNTADQALSALRARLAPDQRPGARDLETLTFPPLAPGEERRHDLALSRGLGFVLTLTRSDTGQPPAGQGRLTYTFPHPSGNPDQTQGGSLFFQNGSCEAGGFDPDLCRLQDGRLFVSLGATRLELPLRNHPVIEDRYRVSAVFPTGRSIRGLVLGPDAQPYRKGCQVSHWPVSQPGKYGEKSGEPATVASDGTFLLEFLPAEVDEYWVDLEGLQGLILPSPVKVRSGSDVTIRLEDGWKLSGKVLDVRGQPVPGATVIVWCETEGHDSARQVDTDAQGGYVLPPFPRRSSLAVAVYPPGLDGMTWVPGKDPVGEAGDEQVPGCGWRDLPPGLPTLDLTLDSSLGLKPYPSR